MEVFSHIFRLSAGTVKGYFQKRHCWVEGMDVTGRRV